MADEAKKEGDTDIQAAAPKGPLQGFVDFIRERGVVGLAIGFVVGGAVTKTVTSLVSDVINPMIGIVAGSRLNFDQMAIGPVKIGSFGSNLIDLVIVTAVVYFIFYKALKLDKLDKQK